jgi:insertion element IS1 protein InsB
MWASGSTHVQKIVHAIKAMERANILYDEYLVYSAIIPKRRLVMSKRGTTGIERNHTPNRHWFVRFKRKSIVVSKSLEMVDLTMALFAKFHVNGDDHLLLDALQT